MAREPFWLVPSMNLFNTLISIEHFSGQKLGDAVSCSQKISSLLKETWRLKEDHTVAVSLPDYCPVHLQMIFMTYQIWQWLVG